MDNIAYYDARGKYVKDIQMYIKQIQNQPIEMTKEDIVLSIRCWRRLYQIADKIEQDYGVDCKFKNDGRIVIHSDGNRALTLPFKFLECEISYLFGAQINKLSNLLQTYRRLPLLDINSAIRTNIDINLSEIAMMSESIVTIKRSWGMGHYSPQFIIKYQVTADRDEERAPILLYTHSTLTQPNGPKHEKITYLVDGTNKYSKIATAIDIMDDI